MSEAFERAVKHALGTDWSDLGVLEDGDGRLHFPAAIEQRTKSGGLKEIPVVLRLPDNRQRVLARKRARERIGELGLDESKDKDYFDELEKYELLAYAIRDPKEPFIQHVPNGTQLYETYGTTTMGKISAYLSLLVDVCDPRYGEISSEQCWQLAARIAARGDAGPLAAIAGFAQNACITFLAKEAVKSPTAPSWVQSPSTSKPASAKTSSKSSST